MQKEHCFRCDNDLIMIENHDEITFYKCEKCNRNYAKSTGKSLTDRWGSAISIPLYLIIFEKEKVAIQRIKQYAKGFYEDREKYDLKILIEEIDDEINHPKQQLIDIHDAYGTEEIARDFLHQLSIEIKKLQS